MKKLIILLVFVVSSLYSCSETNSNVASPNNDTNIEGLNTEMMPETTNPNNNLNVDGNLDPTTPYTSNPE
ncbi:MAG: hypothetical protein UR28_C0012G0002 [Candidatus Peregrinibacteria bacterium GW2011_GWF2_33_10]|nr:MAG: hypothetical protein UR28_C0012G0002 [Candidatus Peregrinibacteria bacterium GW2011_GWF2_33_10]OGJ44090.1 MAG: hypothetical protein A2263_01665 [Candidatus Peregrinibacteria bacterium RIFOXYA2_FULL_33_21]OGJ51385.1 MAG: hypothetical protein A2307_02440 [Candidatus Peregrinibacteria bacterium RIFOXYB2_FULL_33_20]